jgi:hypothetical protein
MTKQTQICDSYKKLHYTDSDNEIQLLINACITIAGITVQHVQPTAVTTATPLQSV